MSKLLVSLPKKDEERLSRLALRYGLSLPTFAARLLSELSDEIPAESLADYDNPRALRGSLDRALKDWKSGKFVTEL